MICTQLQQQGHISWPVNQEDRKWFSGAVGSSNRFKGFAWLLAPEPKAMPLPAPTIKNIIISPEFVATLGQID